MQSNLTLSLLFRKRLKIFFALVTETVHYRYTPLLTLLSRVLRFVLPHLLLLAPWAARQHS